MKPIIVLFVAFILFLSPTHSTAEDHSSATWIHGKWELSYEPDGSPKDFITFFRNGTVVNSLPGNEDTRGTYSIVGGRVKIVFKPGNTSFPIEMRIAEQRTKLIIYSQRSGNTAEYTKVRE